MRAANHELSGLQDKTKRTRISRLLHFSVRSTDFRAKKKRHFYRLAARVILVLKKGTLTADILDFIGLELLCFPEVSSSTVIHTNV